MRGLLELPEKSHPNLEPLEDGGIIVCKTGKGLDTILLVGFVLISILASLKPTLYIEMDGLGLPLLKQASVAGRQV